MSFLSDACASSLTAAFAWVWLSFIQRKWYLQNRPVLWCNPLMQTYLRWQKKRERESAVEIKRAPPCTSCHLLNQSMNAGQPVLKDDYLTQMPAVNLYKQKGDDKPVFRCRLSLVSVVLRGARACLTTPWPLVVLWYLLVHSNLGSSVGVLQTSADRKRSGEQEKLPCYHEQQR